MLDISQVYRYRGIIRDENNCEYKDSWQAYECHGLDMKMLIIESMDSDTETRRLSPVAIFSDDNKYVDLINGPQGKLKKYFYYTQIRVCLTLLVLKILLKFRV